MLGNPCGPTHIHHHGRNMVIMCLYSESSGQNAGGDLSNELKYRFALEALAPFLKFRMVM